VAESLAGTFDALPMLGRGKHRNPKKGACFMELASFLAGERWSDHPQCTHPLLAMLARAVNDLTSDEARPQLAPLIPSVIGLTSDDPRMDVHHASLEARFPAGKQRLVEDVEAHGRPFVGFLVVEGALHTGRVELHDRPIELLGIGAA
jgi:hypothetical protein